MSDYFNDALGVKKPKFVILAYIITKKGPGGAQNVEMRPLGKQLRNPGSQAGGIYREGCHSQGDTNTSIRVTVFHLEHHASRPAPGSSAAALPLLRTPRPASVSLPPALAPQGCPHPSSPQLSRSPAPLTASSLIRESLTLP